MRKEEGRGGEDRERGTLGTVSLHQPMGKSAGAAQGGQTSTLDVAVSGRYVELMGCFESVRRDKGGGC